VKHWGLEALLTIVIVVCGYLLVTDVRDVVQTRQHYHRMRRTTDYYTDLFQKERARQTNNVTVRMQHADNLKL
jgi:hypothetical protein